MKNNAVFSVFIVSLVLLSFAFIYGCGSNASGGGSSIGGRVYYGASSQGGSLQCTVTDTSFNAVIKSGGDAGATFSGPMRSCGNGFLSVEVISSSNIADVPLHTILYFVELTGEVLIGGNTTTDANATLVICPAYNSTPPVRGSYEAIMVPWSDWDTQPTFAPSCAYATMELGGSGSTYAATIEMYDISDTFLASTPDAGYAFTGGRLFKDNDSIQIFVNTKGLFAASNPDTDGAIAGCNFDADVSTTDATSRTYEGFSYSIDGNGSTNLKNYSIQFVPAGPGLMDLFVFNSGPMGPETLFGTVEFTGVDEKRIIQGQLNIVGFTFVLRAVADQVGGKYKLFCFAFDNSGTPDRACAMVLVEK